MWICIQLIQYSPPVNGNIFQLLAAPPILPPDPRFTQEQKMRRMLGDRVKSHSFWRTEGAWPGYQRVVLVVDCPGKSKDEILLDVLGFVSIGYPYAAIDSVQRIKPSAKYEGMESYDFIGNSLFTNQKLHQVEVGMDEVQYQALLKLSRIFHRKYIKFKR